MLLEDLLMPKKIQTFCGISLLIHLLESLLCGGTLASESRISRVLVEVLEPAAALRFLVMVLPDTFFLNCPLSRPDQHYRCVLASFGNCLRSCYCYEPVCM